jgi:hypothetical protein
LAEINVADLSHIVVKLKVFTAKCIEENFAEIQKIDVMKCSASRHQDFSYILRKINEGKGVEAFNTDLRLILGGMAWEWMHRQIEAQKLEIEKRTQAESSIKLGLRLTRLVNQRKGDDIKKLQAELRLLRPANL